MAAVESSAHVGAWNLLAIDSRTEGLCPASIGGWGFAGADTLDPIADVWLRFVNRGGVSFGRDGLYFFCGVLAIVPKHDRLARRPEHHSQLPGIKTH
jgi:hypothetical protein